MLWSRPPFGFLSSSWLVSGVSLSLISLLLLLLRSPWDDRGISGGKTLRLYCAAGVQKPVAKILNDYHEAYDVQFQADYKGSADLLTSIMLKHGHGDLFLAADAFQIEKARAQGLIAEVIPVAAQRPVLIVKSTTQEALRRQGKPVTKLADLLRPDLKVVFASPGRTSIGDLLEKVLSRPDIALWAKLKAQQQAREARVSEVGTVTEVGNVIRTRDNYLGIVWEPNAFMLKGIDSIKTPELAAVHEPLQIAVLAKSADPTAALQFARYLTARDGGLAEFAKYQYEVPADADHWAEWPQLTLAAGAMLKPGIESVVKNFAEREGVTIKTIYNGCGILVSQMEAIKKAGPQGGSFPDAYFACDTSYMTMVEPWFDAATTISKNQMVLTTRKGNPRDIKPLIEELTRHDLQIGLGHPKNSALGKLTDDLLKKLSLHQDVYSAERKFPVVHTDAGHDLVNKVRLGALDAAVVYRSNVLNVPDHAAHFDILDLGVPEALATQPFAIAKNTRHRYLMQRLQQAIVADSTAARFRTLGFQWVHDPKKP